MLKKPLIQALLVAEIGFWPIAGALIAQYGFDYPPCKLCLYQRYPYFAMMGMGLFAVFFLRDRPLPALLYVGILCCLASASVALFHTGVESGWWAFESACIPEIGVADSLNSLKDSILRAPLVSCDQAMVYFLGLSMAAWNIIYGLIACVFLLYTLRICVRHELQQSAPK